ncbi:hypothetical protein [Neptuniibacter sp. QD37_11]|uniref:hypothetical protein n=1 Tax=Neptuniibacter sp. QD37_11 TaxID=3398209 RepID=UPI0039F5C453
MSDIIKPALVAVEETQGLSEEIQAQTGRFFVVYLYDANQQVNCCELTPSYELEPIYYVCEHPISDELDQSLHEEAARSDVRYIWASSIDGMEDAVKEDGSLYDSLEEAREYYQGNRWEPDFSIKLNHP